MAEHRNFHKGRPVGIQTREPEENQREPLLRGAGQKIRDMFLKNMSDRAGKILKDDIATLGPVKLRDVDDAQAGIVATAKELAGQGLIEISESKEEELIL